MPASQLPYHNRYSTIYEDCSRNYLNTFWPRLHKKVSAETQTTGNIIRPHRMHGVQRCLSVCLLDTTVKPTKNWTERDAVWVVIITLISLSHYRASVWCRIRWENHHSRRELQTLESKPPLIVVVGFRCWFCDRKGPSLRETASFASKLVRVSRR